ncbi:MAG: AMP-binding protein, partial [Acidimicrobiales bacterium]
FLRRAAAVHPGHTAVVDGALRLTYAELEDRCLRLAGSLAALAGGRPVAVLAANSHVLLESHFAVPWAGSPLVALNTRLTPGELAWIVEHSEACLLVHTEEHAEAAAAVAALRPGLPTVCAGGTDDGYEALVRDGRPTAVVPEDERALLSVNYTSGTTGTPKGVMYHHRGAYLQSLAMLHHAALSAGDTLLWTLPMFHCNGWCFPWAATAAAATHVCVRQLDPAEVWRLITAESVSIFCGAPTVLSMVARAPEARPVDRPVRVLTGGSPPTPAIIRRMGELGISVLHLYGLTETFGPIMVNDWHPDWDGLGEERRAVLLARQGVGNVIAVPPRVVDARGRDVPADGVTTGEIALRGNDLMLGYLKDPEATAAAVPDGWFRTGDLGVLHPDGYVELRDRAKDVIISGGENISSVEVEAVLAEHPDVLECAVVAAPDEHWGEVPVAFVTPVEGTAPQADELVAWVRGRIAHFKAPRRVVFGPLPKTSTGKIQKFALRRQAGGGVEAASR